MLDAPVQMQRELTRLQQASGQLAPDDLEALLGALAQNTPMDGAAPTSIGFAPGELRAAGWPLDEAGLGQVQGALERSGWRARSDGAELTVQTGSRP